MEEDDLLDLDGEGHSPHSHWYHNMDHDAGHNCLDDVENDEFDEDDHAEGIYKLLKLV
jgi:hypothetical protein